MEEPLEGVSLCFEDMEAEIGGGRTEGLRPPGCGGGNTGLLPQQRPLHQVPLVTLSGRIPAHVPLGTGDGTGCCAGGRPGSAQIAPVPAESPQLILLLLTENLSGSREAS